MMVVRRELQLHSWNAVHSTAGQLPNVAPETPLYSAQTSVIVRGCPRSAVQPSVAFLQIRLRPTRRHPEIGYILATSGRPGR